MHLINHVCLVLDASSSMNHLRDDVVKVADKQIAFLAELSKKFDQETRVSVYVFADKCTNVIFDKDVLRLPSMAGLYKPYGNTALVDAANKCIDDLGDTSILYGDHAFLVYVLTDGQDNRSTAKAIQQVLPNWTVSALVPNSNAAMLAKQYGFPTGNIEVWDVSAKGLVETGERMETVTTQYMENRAKGVRGTSNLFALTKPKAVSRTLNVLKASAYNTLRVDKDTPIKEFMERHHGGYTIGSCYYLLMKKEKIQATKNIILINKKSGKAYGGDDARQLLGLPDTEVKVAPLDCKDYHIFVQSTSVNRKLIAGTNVVVMLS